MFGFTVDRFKRKVFFKLKSQMAAPYPFSFSF